jgi:hypothetical protein
MNNISWRVVPKGKVWYWEREDTSTVLRTGPFSSYTACAADANWNGFELDNLPKVAKPIPPGNTNRKSQRASSARTR